MRAGAAALAAILATVALRAADPAEVTLTGEIIDSACYIKSGSRGESHRVCAQRCGDVGIPLALLVDKTDEVVWIASVDDLETPNAKLRPFAGRKATVTGVWAERGGAKILLLHSVKAASPS
jgi:hypothetical protein